MIRSAKDNDLVGGTIDAVAIHCVALVVYGPPEFHFKVADAPSIQNWYFIYSARARTSRVSVIFTMASAGFVIGWISRLCKRHLRLCPS